MSEVIVLDTHIWLWLVNANFDRFPTHWTALFEETMTLGVSSVSCYEIALAHKRGRLELSGSTSEWFAEALLPFGIELLPIDEEIAVCAANLSAIHKDPFDRLIIATAIVNEARLASMDGLFPKYPE